MEEAYAVKQAQFLGKPVSYVCQNVNGPCPLLAIANVLLLRGQLSLDEYVVEPGVVSAHDLMQLVHRRLVDTNPPRAGASELERLTQEKTLQDVAELLPSLLVGLDVNVRFHNITDFEYTVACAAFDMLDIALVHGWLLDQQDDATTKVVGDKSYNELIERLVDYRAVLMTEEANAASAETDTQAQDEHEAETPGAVPTAENGAERTQEEQEVKSPHSPLPPPLETHTVNFQELTIDADTGASMSSPRSSTSTSSPKKSPSKQTVQTMMKERHISDADAMDTATTLLDEGPILEEFFNSTASQLTYYGLVKLHEEVRERQLCVFFRNNHFSTLFKFDGALYLLVTDAGYLDEPNVVWERLNEIDGDTEYLDAQFRPADASEQQQSIFTQQQQQREQVQQAASDVVDTATATATATAAAAASAAASASDEAMRAAEHTVPPDGLFGSPMDEDQEDMDPDYLLALKFQREEEELARRNKPTSPRMSPRHLQPRSAGSTNAGPTVDATTSRSEEERGERQESSELDESRDDSTEHEYIPAVSTDGEMVVSEEMLEAQRQAELYYQERKRRSDAQTLQYQQQEEDVRQRQRMGQLRRQEPRGSDGNCVIS